MIKSIIKDSFIYSSVSIIFAGVSFFTFPIFVKILSVEEYGIMSLISTITAFLSMVINFGINNSIQRFYYDKNNNNENYKKILISTGLLFLSFWAVLITGIMIFISFFFKEFLFEKYGIVYIFLVLSFSSLIPASLTGYIKDIFRLQFKPIKFAVIAFFYSFLGLVLGIILVVLLKKGIYGVFLGGLIGSIGAVIFALIAINKEIGFCFDRKFLVDILKFGYPFIFANISLWFYGSADRWIIAHFCSMTEVGIYSVAFKFASIMSILNSSIGQAWAPYIYKLFGEDKDYQIKIARISDFILITGSVVCILIGFFIQDGLFFLTKREYYGAGNTILILLVAILFSLTHQISPIGISLSKKTFFISAGWVITTIFNILLNFLFVPKMGALGSALALLICYFGLSIYYIIVGQKVFPMKYNFRNWIYILVFIVLGICISLVLNQIGYNIIIFIIKITIIVIISLILFINRVKMLEIIKKTMK